MKLLSLLAVATHAVAQAMTSQGTTVRLDSTDYFISPVAKGAVPRSAINPGSLRHAMGFAPVTVVAGAVSPETLGSLFANWTTTDDVWSPGFLGGLVLRAASDNAGQHGKFEASYHNGTRSTVFSIREEPGVPSGPYFVNVYSGQLHEAYRLYDDFSGSFTESLLQLPDGTFQPLGGRSQSSGTLTIGVPSRLYSVGAADKPLAGVRIGVKDLYDLAGVRSSRGNRAWYGLYPPANQTAPAIQNLIDAGAVIVGYQKLSQFANGAGTTGDWVDYHAPFNPRGDGYQVPSSSSSGAGASVASYPWLDLAVGSDTGGSVRGPAGVNGLFGNRPTHGLVSLGHVMPLSPALDTAGLLARDPRIWAAAQKAMYRDNFTALAPGSAKYPGTIYTLGFPELHTLRGSVLHKFSRDLAALLGATVTQYDLDAHWHKSAPETVSSVPLSDLLNLTYSALITKQQIPLVREPFYKDYAGKWRTPCPSGSVLWSEKRDSWVLTNLRFCG